MDFKDTIKQLAERIQKLKDNIQTEEATKNAFIMPFINALGYDVFNPLEVIPEMVCDIGTKKGEKIDYAIMKEDAPILLIECKHWKQDLNLHDNQLLRYFNVSKAKFALLTNGIVYRFYTDLKELNKMDDKPFLEFDMSAIKESQIVELKKFHKSYFDVNNILNSASELKYMGELKAIIQKELTAPSPELVKLFSKQVYEGMMYQNVLDQFSMLVKRSISSYINDLISDRLKGALAVEEQKTTTQEEADQKNEEPESKIITTEEELEAYRIVKAICRQKIDVVRVVHRDTQTYFGILLDDNNRKPICRMYFNSTNKYVATFDADKKEVKHMLTSLDDIYNFSDHFLKTIELYDSKLE